MGYLMLRSEGDYPSFYVVLISAGKGGKLRGSSDFEEKGLRKSDQLQMEISDVNERG
jgi:hypothetical protein